MKFNKAIIKNQCISDKIIINKYGSKMCWIFLIVFELFVLGSCKKFIEVQPPTTSINGINVFSDDATATAVLTGIYTSMSNEVLPSGVTAMSVLPSLSGDELTLYANSAAYLPFYSNTITSASNSVFWSPLYTYIFKCNEAIAGLSGHVNNLTPVVYNQLSGEAKFIRAFCYFYLVNLYGDVPLALQTDPNVNRLLPRTAKDQIYQQIIIDLKDAQDLLSENFLDGTVKNISAERVRPSKWAATALLARVYLYTKDWASAESEATKVLTNSGFSLSTLNNAFLKTSLANKEAIWQLQPTGSGVSANTKEGRLFILPSAGPNSSWPIVISDTLFKSFEPGDQRKTNWIASITPPPGTNTYYYPYKYKIGSVNTTTSEYSMVLRLAEQYLIRAEARTKQNNLPSAIADVDSIRKRAGLPLIKNTNPGITQSALLNVILHERQVELFAEWGHRWFDLKRTGNIDALMTIIAPRKGGTWNPNWALYPIPQLDIDRNPNLVGHQNPGY